MSCRSHCFGEECPVEGCNAACALNNHLLTPIEVRGNSDSIINNDIIIDSGQGIMIDDSTGQLYTVPIATRVMN
jgi:hypothetical protein